MTEETLVHIRWRGKESISEAVQYIREHHNIEIELPANYHHSCYTHLYPESDPDTPDFINVENGVDIIRKISEVSGLEDFNDLTSIIRETGAKVLMKSPTPRIFIGFDINEKRYKYY